MFCFDILEEEGLGENIKYQQFIAVKNALGDGANFTLSILPAYTTTQQTISCPVNQTTNVRMHLNHLCSASSNSDANVKYVNNLHLWWLQKKC